MEALPSVGSTAILEFCLRDKPEGLRSPAILDPHQLNCVQAALRQHPAPSETASFESNDIERQPISGQSHSLSGASRQHDVAL